MEPWQIDVHGGACRLSLAVLSIAWSFSRCATPAGLGALTPPRDGGHVHRKNLRNIQFGPVLQAKGSCPHAIECKIIPGLLSRRRIARFWPARFAGVVSSTPQHLSAWAGQGLEIRRARGCHWGAGCHLRCLGPAVVWKVSITPVRF